MLAKTYTATLLVLSLLIVTAPVAASTAINRLDLDRDGNYTVLTIRGDGQVRYAHESVEAKEGKPFRIVIDCLASRHDLPRFHFSKLPQSIVTSIRTSQYSVAPEEVVRVVLDLADESVYRVEPFGSAVKVYVSDQKTAPFNTWTSGTKSVPQDSRKEPVETAEVTETPAPQQKKAPAETKPAVTARKKKPAAPSTEIARLPAPDNAQTPSPKAAATTDKPAPKAQPPAETKAAKKPAPARDLANDSIQRAKAFASMQQAPKAAPKPSAEQKPQKKESASEPPKETKAEPQKKPAPEMSHPSKPELPAPSPVAEEKDKELAETSPEPEKVDISRYRRARAKEAEMKASQVVEFPKRMVIKYKRTNPRDPFETLIALNANDKKRNIDLNRIPHIESLHLVGVLESVLGKDAALLEDRDGIGYILRTGDRVKNGYVAQIDDSAVYFQINEYGWSRTVVKHMEEEN